MLLIQTKENLQLNKNADFLDAYAKMIDISAQYLLLGSWCKHTQLQTYTVSVQSSSHNFSDFLTEL